MGPRRQGERSGQSRSVDRGADPRADERGPSRQGSTGCSCAGSKTDPTIPDSRSQANATPRGLRFTPGYAFSEREPSSGLGNRSRIAPGCLRDRCPLGTDRKARVHGAHRHIHPAGDHTAAPLGRAVFHERLAPGDPTRRQFRAGLRTDPEARNIPLRASEFTPAGSSRWRILLVACRRRSSRGAHAPPRNGGTARRSIVGFPLASTPGARPGSSCHAGRRPGNVEFPTLAAERLHVFGGNPPTRTAADTAAEPVPGTGTSHRR